MRKITILFVITMFTGLAVVAQEAKSTKLKPGYGLKTGLNISHFAIDNLPAGAESNWRTGFVFGGFLNIPFSQKFSIQPEFGYSSMGGDFLTPLQENIRARYNYFSIPVLFKYRFKKWALVLGPQVDFLIQAKESMGIGKFDVTSDIEDHDFLGTAGFEFWPSNSVFFQGRYMRGFTDIDPRDNNIKTSNEGVQITFGVRLNGPKKPKPVVAPPPPPPPAVEPPKDSDNDGVTDDKDKCPTTPGLAKYDGCPIPDTDKDGINDEEDKCPSVPGVARYQGCPPPDTDGDGINDEEDKCPQTPGPKENQGCPAVNEAVKEKIDLAANKTFFVTNSSKLQTVSYKALDEVVKIMNENPELKITVHGHTDNTGTAAINKTLSQKRAESVMAYFTSKGIDASRLEAVGHGSEMPIADNKTAEGRKQNRRVELDAHY